MNDCKYEDNDIKDDPESNYQRTTLRFDALLCRQDQIFDLIPNFTNKTEE